MIKILIVEDQKIVRDSLVHNFSAQDGFLVVGETGNADEAPFLCREADPDVVLMDICTQNDASGIDAAEKIKALSPEKKVVIMTGMMEVTFVERSKAAGADSFLYKNVGWDEMVSVIKGTVMGYSTYPNERPTGFAKRFQDLTEREVAILLLLCDGKNRSEIAKELNLSEGSVKSYTSGILSKTGFSSTSRLAIYAISKGFIHPKI